MQVRFLGEHDQNIDAETAFLLLKCGDYAGAYLLLKDVSNESQISAKYNLSLCLVNAEQYEKAADTLECALSALKRMSMVQLKTDEVYEKLLEHSEKRYLSPMPQKLPEVLPQICKENIYRLLIDVYMNLGLWGKVRPLTHGLQNFTQVQNVLVKLEGK